MNSAIILILQVIKIESYNIGVLVQSKYKYGYVAKCKWQNNIIKLDKAQVEVDKSQSASWKKKTLKRQDKNSQT